MSLRGLSRVLRKAHARFLGGWARANRVRLPDTLIRRIDPSANADHHRDVLRGLIPLDAADEGFAGIGVNITLDALYAFFETRISEYERDEARRIVTQVRSSNPRHD